MVSELCPVTVHNLVYDTPLHPTSGSPGVQAFPVSGAVDVSSLGAGGVIMTRGTDWSLPVSGTVPLQ